MILGFASPFERRGDTAGEASLVFPRVRRGERPAFVLVLTFVPCSALAPGVAVLGARASARTETHGALHRCQPLPGHREVPGQDRGSQPRRVRPRPAHPSRLIACRHRIETARVEKSPNPRALTPRSSTPFRIFRRRSGRSAGIVRASAEDSRIIRVESKLECVSRREPRAIGARATRRAAFPGTAIGSVGVAPREPEPSHLLSRTGPSPPRPLPPRSDAPGPPPAPRARD